MRQHAPAQACLLCCQPAPAAAPSYLLATGFFTALPSRLAGGCPHIATPSTTVCALLHVQAGRGATLLIHEATFEPCLADQAARKRHSTTEQALAVAQVSTKGSNRVD